MTAVAVTLAVLAFYALFYRKVVRHWGRPAEWVVGRLRLGSTRSVREIEAMGKLMAAGVAQALFVAVLLLVLDVDLGAIAHQRLDRSAPALRCTTAHRISCQCLSGVGRRLRHLTEKLSHERPHM